MKKIRIISKLMQQFLHSQTKTVGLADKSKEWAEEGRKIRFYEPIFPSWRSFWERWSSHVLGNQR
ncbi:hypothetical protein LEP1GSC194_1459 [Leptospira alstonii serovar Sichuan str. 79601]|uniref:Uncharacterized protein n=2 Tax=Leptospira alstonii TaxID=28452 RepID=M6CQA6_9LEPT|nr:hypothetical protein LEP1GSC194_1459 [Leptospira alstonii serovar Sichuan str. 79601]